MGLWLKNTGGLMFCTSCKKDGVTEKDSVFVKGSAEMRQDGIKYHEVKKQIGDFNSAAK